MKIVSWNVNGLRSVLNKDKNGTKILEGESVIETLIKEQNPDIICLQEIRCANNINLTKINLEKYGYTNIILNCSTIKAGYSGTAIFSKIKPISFKLGEDNEGRLITAEYYNFILINAYVPNAKPDLSRLDYRINTWEKMILNYIIELQNNSNKYIIYCGDLNVANKDIDVHSPKTAKGKHGFTLEERNSFQTLLDKCNMIDSFRTFHPTEKKYSWFSNFAQSRQKNKGWRIDYFITSKKLQNKIINTDILLEYFGSDHAVILLDINF